jgi:hypothetical protein
MFIEETKQIKLGGGFEDHQSKVTMEDLNLPLPTSKFFTGEGRVLRTPAWYGICLAKSCPPYTKLNKAFGGPGDITFDFPMNQYVDLYRNIYDSNDLDYVLNEVATWNVRYADNLYEVSRWSNKDTLNSDLELGILMFTDTLHWVRANV